MMAYFMPNFICAALLLFPLSYCVVSSYEVRLEPPSNETTAKNKGTVLVRYNSTSLWGTVCDDGWGIQDARVVCRMLGFMREEAYHERSFFGIVPGYNMSLDDVGCLGTESNLVNCGSSAYGTHNCGSTEQAGVTCSPWYNVRLEPPFSEPAARNKGTVLVRNNTSNAWGTICDDNWDINDARVVCRMLGFYDVITYHTSSHFGAHEKYKMVLDEVNCNGTEDNLFQCRSNPYGDHNCGSSEQAGVTCAGYEVRLEPPSNEPTARNKGTVLVRYNSTSPWGTICDNDWNNRNAYVVCRMLGFPSATAFHRYSEFGSLAGYQTLLDNVICSGVESNLYSCKSKRYGTTSFDSHRQAGVTCGGNYEVRIEPVDLKTWHRGTVLVRYNSTSPWGTVCDRNWDIMDANVVCKMLGFPRAAASHINSAFKPYESIPYLLDDVGCNGEEGNLAQCINDQYGSSQCAKPPQRPFGGNAGVTCVMPIFQVRLEPPENEITKHKGTMLVRYNYTSSWGTICDNYWGINDANVICRMLGFPNASTVHRASEFGVREDCPILLDDLECSGNESNLANCYSWRRFGNHGCSTKQQAGVTCYREVCTENSCSGHGKCFHVDDGTTMCVCDHGYTSKKGETDSYVMRRMDISATYKVLCQRLDTNSTILQDVIDFRFQDIEQILSGIAKRSNDEKVTMTCTNDVLRVNWPTSLTYTAGVTSLPKEVHSTIVSKLSGKSTLLDLFLPTNIPPVLRPQITGTGLVADLVLTSFCKNKRAYSSASDTCM